MKTGEWGEFMPASISPMGYNETIASTYFPRTREEALAEGFIWSEYESPKPQASKIIPGAKLPEDIKHIPDDVLNWAIECEATGKLFKIVPQELRWYRQQNIPMPTLHPEERVFCRMTKRNPRKLYDRTCEQCQTTLKTTYSLESPEKILCEKCFVDAVI